MGSKINALRVTNIIITCGTSICNEETIENSTHLKASQKLDDNPSSFDDIYKSIENNYKSLEIEDLGAEINILSKLGNIENDNIYFFFSETKGGELVKKLFNETDVLKEKIGDYKYNFKTISGFTVDNENDFKTKAIPNFYAELEEIKKTEIETIMCPVGGYKALIPYASLYSMVNGWDIKYIYEDSDELIDLPSGALTNLSGNLILKDELNINIFNNNETLTSSYDYQNGLKLSIGIKNFIEYGKSNELSEICEKIEKIFIEKKVFNEEKKCLSNLKKYLLNLSYAFDLIRLKDIKENICNILKIETNELKDQLLKNSIEFLQSKLEKIETENIVSWYYENRRYAETILIMREGTIDFVGEKLNISYNEREDRLKIENTLQLFKFDNKDPNRRYLLNYQEIKMQNIFKGKETFFEKLTNKRNNFAHINENESLETMKKGIEKLYAEYLEITSKTTS